MPEKERLSSNLLHSLAKALSYSSLAIYDNASSDNIFTYPVSLFGIARYCAMDSLYFPESYNSFPLVIISEALINRGFWEKHAAEITKAAANSQKRIIVIKKNIARLRKKKYDYATV